jgi:hypothetical protein
MVGDGNASDLSAKAERPTDRSSHNSVFTHGVPRNDVKNLVIPGRGANPELRPETHIKILFTPRR